jgi:hypothetical protein
MPTGAQQAYIARRSQVASVSIGAVIDFVTAHSQCICSMRISNMIVDTNRDCTDYIDILLDQGVTAIGRYYRKATHPEWAITKSEAQKLGANKIKLFVVFEDFGLASKLVLTKQQGQDDGASALDQARAIGQPAGGVIYFAAEGLPHGYKSGRLRRRHRMQDSPR